MLCHSIRSVRDENYIQSCCEMYTNVIDEEPITKEHDNSVCTILRVC